MTSEELAMLHDPDMRLPQGALCDDCKSFRRCKAFGVTREGQMHCDWAPSRFNWATRSQSAKASAETKGE